MPAVSYRKFAEDMNMLRSSVHPSRSSRYGQSVGTLRKFPRMLQTAFSCKRFTSSCEQVKWPVRRKSVWITSATIRVRSQSPDIVFWRPPLYFYVSESMECEPWYPIFERTTVADECICGFGFSQRTRIKFVALQHFRVPKHYLVSACLPFPCDVRRPSDTQSSDKILAKIKDGLA